MTVEITSMAKYTYIHKDDVEDAAQSFHLIDEDSPEDELDV